MTKNKQITIPELASVLIKKRGLNKKNEIEAIEELLNEQSEKDIKYLLEEMKLTRQFLKVAMGNLKIYQKKRKSKTTEKIEKS